MPNKTLCPKCHGQRTVSCLECHGSGKKSIMAIPFGDCKECGGTGDAAVMFVVAWVKSKMSSLT
jgi:DnaJ-class molecular chaperone